MAASGNSSDPASSGPVVSKSAERRYVGHSADVPERGRLVVEVAGTIVGVFRVGGELYAYENICVHQGGPACQGRIVPRVRQVLNEEREAVTLVFDEDDMHVVCPGVEGQWPEIRR
jgi:nitrite reductase/ring-hydroxylating ferredoxin subunit